MKVLLTEEQYKTFRRLRAVLGLLRIETFKLAFLCRGKETKKKEEEESRLISGLCNDWLAIVLILPGEKMLQFRDEWDVLQQCFH